MDDEDKSTVYDILKIIEFYTKTHREGLNSARLKDALYNQPKTIDKLRNPPLPAIGNVEDSYEEVSEELEAEGFEKRSYRPT